MLRSPNGCIVKNFGELGVKTEMSSDAVSKAVSRINKRMTVDRELAKRIKVRYHVHIMKAITYTEARESLSETMNRVCEDHSPVVITKRRKTAVVMMALDDYEALVETSYLLKSPRNAQRLLESILQLQEGGGTQRELISLLSQQPVPIGS